MRKRRRLLIGKMKVLIQLIWKESGKNLERVWPRQCGTLFSKRRSLLGESALLVVWRRPERGALEGNPMRSAGYIAMITIMIIKMPSQEFGFFFQSEIRMIALVDSAPKAAGVRRKAFLNH